MTIIMERCKAQRAPKPTEVCLTNRPVIFSLTQEKFPDFSLIFPVFQNSLTFPSFPGRWEPCSYLVLHQLCKCKHTTGFSLMKFKTSFFTWWWVYTFPLNLVSCKAIAEYMQLPSPGTSSTVHPRTERSRLKSSAGTKINCPLMKKEYNYR